MLPELTSGGAALRGASSMAEQRTFNPLVQGSTPWRPTCGFRVSPSCSVDRFVDVESPRALHRLGGRQSPGAAWTSPAASPRGGLRRGRPRRPVCRPERPAGGTRRYDPASWRPANSQRPRPPGRRGQARPVTGKADLAPAWFGKSALPEPPATRVGVSRNLRAPAASLRDRLRRHLTEPVRRGER